LADNQLQGVGPYHEAIHSLYIHQVKDYIALIAKIIGQKQRITRQANQIHVVASSCVCYPMPYQLIGRVKNVARQKTYGRARFA